MEQKIEHLLIESIIKNSYTIDDFPDSLQIRQVYQCKTNFKAAFNTIQALKEQLMKIDSFREKNVFNLSNMIGVPPFVCRLLVNDI